MKIYVLEFGLDSRYGKVLDIVESKVFPHIADACEIAAEYESNNTPTILEYDLESGQITNTWHDIPALEDELNKEAESKIWL